VYVSWGTIIGVLYVYRMVQWSLVSVKNGISVDVFNPFVVPAN